MTTGTVAPLAACLILTGAIGPGKAYAQGSEPEPDPEQSQAASSTPPVRSNVYVVTADVAPVFNDPRVLTKVVATLKKGRRVVLTGEEQNGYYRIHAKGGAGAWVSAAFIEPEGAPREKSAVRGAPSAAGAEPGANVGRRARRTGLRAQSADAVADEDDDSGSSWLGLHAVTFDLGGSFGSYGERNYTEIDLGLNLYLNPYLVWRNAVFGRFASGVDTLYGWDTSGRGVLSLGSGLAGLTAFAGPGYRFVNGGGNVPFAEGGVVLKLAGISLGGGVKTLLHSWVRSGSANDTQYFLILAGGGSL